MNSVVPVKVTTYFKNFFPIENYLDFHIVWIICVEQKAKYNLFMVPLSYLNKQKSV